MVRGGSGGCRLEHCCGRKQQAKQLGTSIDSEALLLCVQESLAQSSYYRAFLNSVRNALLVDLTEKQAGRRGPGIGSVRLAED